MCCVFFCILSKKTKLHFLSLFWQPNSWQDMPKRESVSCLGGSSALCRLNVEQSGRGALRRHSRSGRRSLETGALQPTFPAVSAPLNFRKGWRGPSPSRTVCAFRGLSQDATARRRSVCQSFCLSTPAKWRQEPARSFFAAWRPSGVMLCSWP